MASIVSAGTTSATALNMSADTTGVLSLASNNGTVGLTMDTSQNVGLGTSLPTRILTIEKSGAAFPSNSNPSIRLNELSSGRFAVIELDSSQNLNIWNGNSGTASTRFYRGSGSGDLSMSIDVSGNLLVGTTNNVFSSRLCVQGNASSSTPDVLIGIPLNASSNTQLQIYRSAAVSGYVGMETVNAAVGGTQLVLNALNGGAVLVGTATALGGKISVEFNGNVINGLRCKTTYASNGSQFVDFLNSSGTQIGYISQNASNTGPAIRMGTLVAQKCLSGFSLWPNSFWSHHFQVFLG
jgi:hypothetical protein